MKSKRDIIYDKFVKEASMGICSDKMIKTISENAEYYIERPSIAYISPIILIQILSNEHYPHISQAIQDDFILRVFEAHGKSAVPLCRYLNPSDKIKDQIYKKLKEYNCEDIFPNYNTKQNIISQSNFSSELDSTEKELLLRCQDTFQQMEIIKQIEAEAVIKPEDQLKLDDKKKEIKQLEMKIEEADKQIQQYRDDEKELEKEKEIAQKELEEQKNREKRMNVWIGIKENIENINKNELMFLERIKKIVPTQ